MADGTMSLDLVIPKELGGPGRGRQFGEALRAGLFGLFSFGYADGVGQDEDQTSGGLDRDGDYRHRPRSEGGFGITAALDVFLPDLPEADARTLVEATHEICSYSNAIKATVDVKITTRS